MRWIYISKAQALAMHEFLITEFGGLQGVRDDGLLDSALAQPKQSAFGDEIYPDAFSKAAAYAYGLSENQPFIDGNKRVAVAVMGTFLMGNGYELTCSQIDLHSEVMKLAKKRVTRKQLAGWLRKNASPLKK